MWFSYVSKWLWNIHHHQNAEKKFFQKQIWFRNGASITAWNTSRYPPFTVFENYPKYHIWILAFSPNFCPIKIDLSTQNVNIARFARNVEWWIDFFKTGDQKLATGTSWKKRRLLQFIISLTLSKLFFVSVKVLENNASKYQVSKLT